MLAGATTSDSVVAAATRLQSVVSRTVAAAGAPTIALAAVAVAVIAGVAAVRWRRQTSQQCVPLPGAGSTGEVQEAEPRSPQ